MTTAVLPLGVSGLVKADLDLRYYVDGVASPGVIAGLAVAEIGASGDYLVSGLPTAPTGSLRTLTWEYPAGAGGSHVYPHSDDAPPNVILPVREAGLIAADLGLVHYLDGAASGTALTAVEVGAPGDYRIAGWDVEEIGLHALRWEVGGVRGTVAWEVEAEDVPAIPTNWAELDYERVAQMIAAGSYTASSDNFLGIFDPGVIPPGGAPEPSVDSNNPTVFGVWGLDYDGDPVQVLDETEEPIRRGRVVFEAWTQLGAGQGYALDLITQAREAFIATPPAGIVFLPALAVPQFIGAEGDFMGLALPIPFVGGASA